MGFNRQSGNLPVNSPKVSEESQTRKKETNRNVTGNKHIMRVFFRYKDPVDYFEDANYVLSLGGETGSNLLFSFPVIHLPD